MGDALKNVSTEDLANELISRREGSLLDAASSPKCVLLCRSSCCSAFRSGSPAWPAPPSTPALHSASGSG